MARRNAAKSRRKAIGDLVHDDRAFDVELTRSVVDFVNVCGRRDLDRRPLEERKLDVVVEHFDWMPDVLVARGGAIKRVWNPHDVPVRQCRNAASNFRAAMTLISMTRSSVPVPDKVVEGIAQYLDNEARFAPTRDRWRAVNGRLQWHAATHFEGLTSCVAYVVGLLAKNRHSLGERVRECPHRPRGEQQPHYFLDYRIDESGALVGGNPMRFCCKSHQKAHQAKERRAKEKQR